MPQPTVSIREFHEVYLQEVNRLFFHPLGMALAVTQHDNGETTLGPILDARDDPEGYIFTTLDKAKIKEVEKRFNAFMAARIRKLGSVVQTENCPD